MGERASQGARPGHRHRRAESESSPRYGRASLRSELMQKILGGVAQQMERLSEEEANERRGEGSGGGVGSRAPGKPPYASSGEPRA